MSDLTGDRRSIALALAALTSADAELERRYRRAKDVVRVFRRPAFYEVATRCNLRCEGCYFFEEGYRDWVDHAAPLSEWAQFFSAEGARGVSMAYFVGAEPALEQKRLLAAAPHFPHGNIGTNGTIRLNPDIRFRIGVSVWAGDDATDTKLRGASVFRKALRNYEGDDRAIMLYTVSRWNIDQTRDVARMCRDHGLPLTFSLYSPTHSFLGKINAAVGNDDTFFRVSSGADSPCLDQTSLAHVRDVLGALIDDFPQTVIYSHAYNRWSTEPGPRYDIDPKTGVAERCGSRMVGTMRYHTTNLQHRVVKCGTSDIDCSQCRIYSGGWSSKFAPQAWNTSSLEAFEDWLDMMDVLGRIFVLKAAPRPETAPQPLAALATADRVPSRGGVASPA